MAKDIFSEDTYEQALIELFQGLESKQYRYEYGPDIERDYSNPTLPLDAIDAAIKKLHQIEDSPLSATPFFLNNVWSN